jgi:hypothetical protein
MRLHIWALKEVALFVEDIKVTGANTGVGNVLANKGGIVITLDYMKTRVTFLSAHLAAHEGESYYQARCDNVHDILRSAKTFDLNQIYEVSVSSHHMFVLGDLNFRTKFDGEGEHEDNVKRALELIKAKDFETLYSFDELQKGIRDGDLLAEFQTLPCKFHPTFKVQREPGFVYKEQRTPSYADRILFKSAEGLGANLEALAYEPCVDFITSDHKPVRGAYSIVPNAIIAPARIGGRFEMVFRDIECSDLPAGDVEGSSDPYVMFVWDSVDITQGTNNLRKSVHKALTGQSWPTTNYKTKTLNPKWKGKEISLVSNGDSVGSEAMLFVTVMDFDFGLMDDYLGTLALNVKELISMKDGENRKEVAFDRPLQRYGKFAGRIKFVLDITVNVKV